MNANFFPSGEMIGAYSEVRLTFGGGSTENFATDSPAGGLVRKYKTASTVEQNRTD